MANLPSKRKPILRIVLLSIAAVPVLFILFIIGSILLSPVFDTIDKARFVKLDNQSRALYEQLKIVSGGAESWTYKASCLEQKSGDWPTGEFTCTTSLSTQVSVASTAQLNSLQNKYYPVIDASKMLKQITELDKQYPSQFGVQFVVSSAEKKYVTSDRNVSCRYLIELSNGKDDVYGMNLTVGSAFATIELSCIDKARGNWYQ